MSYQESLEESITPRMFYDGKANSVKKWQDDYLVQYFDNYNSGHLSEEAPKHWGENDIVIIAGRQDVISLSLFLSLSFSLALPFTLSYPHSQCDRKSMGRYKR